MVAIVLIALAGTGLGALIAGAGIAKQWPEAIVAGGLALVIGVGGVCARAVTAACADGCDGRPTTAVVGIAVILVLCSGLLWVRASRGRD